MQGAFRGHRTPQESSLLNMIRTLNTSIRPLGLATLIALALVVTACGGKNGDTKSDAKSADAKKGDEKKEAKKEGGEGEEEEGPKPVTVEAVVRGAIDRVVTADAVLYPNSQSNVTPKISAPVKRVMANRGDHVRAGQLIADRKSTRLNSSH